MLDDAPEQLTAEEMAQLAAEAAHQDAIAEAVAEIHFAELAARKAAGLPEPPVSDSIPF